MRRLFSVRGDQLGTRIEALLSTWRFARKLNRQACVFWPKYGENYHPSLFFDMDRLATLEDLRIVPGESLLPEGTVDLKSAEGWQVNLNHKFVSSISADIDAGGALNLRFRCETSKDLLLQKKCLFDKLPWNRDILHAVEEAESWLGFKEFAAVHIRRGDVVRLTQDCFKSLVRSYPVKVPPDEEEKVVYALKKYLGIVLARITDGASYVQALEKWNRLKLPVVLFTDSDIGELGAEVQSLNPRQISSFQSGLSWEQTATMEMLLLCRASLLISTNSYFSKIAYSYGRPTFHDARKALGKAGITEIFDRLFGSILARSEPVREMCLSLLERLLGTDPVYSESGLQEISQSRTAATRRPPA